VVNTQVLNKKINYTTAVFRAYTFTYKAGNESLSMIEIQVE
jgi:hypothetical protein